MVRLRWYDIDIHLTKTMRAHSQRTGASMELDQEEDDDARQQLEGLRVVYGACCQFWLGTEAAAEAVEVGTTRASSLPLSAAMMLDRWSLLLHPDRPSCITPHMIARKVMFGVHGW